MSAVQNKNKTHSAEWSRRLISRMNPFPPVINGRHETRLECAHLRLLCPDLCFQCALYRGAGTHDLDVLIRSPKCRE